MEKLQPNLEQTFSVIFPEHQTLHGALGITDERYGELIAMVESKIYSSSKEGNINVLDLITNIYPHILHLNELTVVLIKLGHMMKTIEDMEGIKNWMSSLTKNI